VRHDALALLHEAEGARARAHELVVALVVALEEQRVVGDEREEHPIAVEAPAAEHAPRRHRPEGAQVFQHQLDELVGFRHHFALTDQSQVKPRTQRYAEDTENYKPVNS